jgi:uncharacterized protein YktB (UPF0637 family)
MADIKPHSSKALIQALHEERANAISNIERHFESAVKAIELREAALKEMGEGSLQKFMERAVTVKVGELIVHQPPHVEPGTKLRTTVSALFGQNSSDQEVEIFPGSYRAYLFILEKKT